VPSLLWHDRGSTTVRRGAASGVSRSIVFALGVVPTHAVCVPDPIGAATNRLWAYLWRPQVPCLGQNDLQNATQLAIYSDVGRIHGLQISVGEGFLDPLGMMSRTLAHCLGSRISRGLATVGFPMRSEPGYPKREAGATGDTDALTLIGIRHPSPGRGGWQECVARCTREHTIIELRADANAIDKET
jgi:hypothetical protein